jgi:hypothetical protein
MTIYLLDQGADVKRRRNENYLASVRGAWAAGHHTLAKTIQEWKKEHYSEEDCQPMEAIVASLLSSDRLGMSLNRCGHERIADESHNASSTDFVPSDGESNSDNDSDSDEDSDSDNDSNSDDDLYIQVIHRLHGSRFL